MATFYGKDSSYLVKNDLKYDFFAVMLLIFVLVVIWIIYKSAPAGISGIAALVGIIFIVKLSEPFIDLFKRKSNKFYRGWAGELDIKHVLQNLPDNFIVFQDVNFPEKRGNIDFVVVGPTGIFTVEAKSHMGNIGFNGYELTLNGRIFPEKNILKQSLSEALRLREFIKQKTDKEVFVKASLVFSKGYGMRFGLKPIDSVYVIGKDFLLSLIRSHPNYQYPLPQELLIEKLRTLVKI